MDGEGAIAISGNPCSTANLERSEPGDVLKCIYSTDVAQIGNGGSAEWEGGVDYCSGGRLCDFWVRE